jgi:hypothetical protein
VSLDLPAAGSALWSLYDRGGPRPEYVLAMLYRESGFDPSTPNHAGAPYYGINQAGEGLIAAYAGVDVATYLTWPASRQIATVVTGMLLGLVQHYGPLRSGIRVEQANFLPATLPSATRLDDVVTSSPSSFYTSNEVLDPAHKGTITLRDLGAFLEEGAGSQAVQRAIAETYALRPSESPRDPVLGDDFAPSASSTLAPVAAAAALVFLSYALVIR